MTAARPRCATWTGSCRTSQRKQLREEHGAIPSRTISLRHAAVCPMVMYAFDERCPTHLLPRLPDRSVELDPVPQTNALTRTRPRGRSPAMGTGSPSHTGPAHMGGGRARRAAAGVGGAGGVPGAGGSTRRRRRRTRCYGAGCSGGPGDRGDACPWRAGKMGTNGDSASASVSSSSADAKSRAASAKSFL